MCSHLDSFTNLSCIISKPLSLIIGDRSGSFSANKRHLRSPDSIRKHRQDGCNSVHLLLRANGSGVRLVKCCFSRMTNLTGFSGYDRKLPSSEQPENIPQTFLDAMEVREQVFVHEQGVPLDNEFDADDARACHWVRSTKPYIFHTAYNHNIGDICLDQHDGGASS